MGKKSKNSVGQESQSPLRESPEPVDRSKKKPNAQAESSKTGKNQQATGSNSPTKNQGSQKVSKAKEEPKESSKA